MNGPPHSCSPRLTCWFLACGLRYERMGSTLPGRGSRCRAWRAAAFACFTALAVALASVARAQASYFPPRGSWETRPPHALGLDEQQTGQWLLPRGHSRMLIRFKFEMPAVLPIPRFAGDTSLAELGVYSFHVFPNLSVVTGPPNSAFLISAFPLSVGRSAYITHFLSPVPRSEETAALIDQSVDANYGVLLEDLAALGPAQKAMASGAADVLRLQYQERRIRYVHEEIDRRIGPERVPEALRVPALLDAYIEEA